MLVRGAILCSHFMSDACSGRSSSRCFFIVIVFCCYMVTYILSFMLSGIVVWYFDRVACSAVVDHFGESLFLYCGMSVSTIGF